jgi:2-methylisocitrate lyase-like PEP mutase family enzyme
MTARIAEQVGHKVVYMGGFATSAAIYGKPDVGLLTATEMIAHARNIVEAVRVPVFADADTGHGNPINVRRTIREYEKAGVAGVHIEDQTHPKKCGNLPDRHVIAVVEMVEKIKAAVDARHDEDFVVAVRSDSYLDCGLNELVDRGHAFAEAGADVFWPLLHNYGSREEMIRVGKSFDIPLMASLVNYSETAFIDVDEWAAMGFRVIISPFGAMQIAAPVIQSFLREILETGSLKGSANRMMSFDTVTDILGLPEINALEHKHGIG